MITYSTLPMLISIQIGRNGVQFNSWSRSGWFESSFKSSRLLKKEHLHLNVGQAFFNLFLFRCRKTCKCCHIERNSAFILFSDISVKDGRFFIFSLDEWSWGSIQSMKLYPISVFSTFITGIIHFHCIIFGFIWSTSSFFTIIYVIFILFNSSRDVSEHFHLIFGFR